MSMVPNFTRRQLRAFLAGAELSNFTLVARTLGLTPSTVSNQIADLEETLGFALFERTTRKVSLTRQGREFLPAAQAVLRQHDRAAIAARDIRNRTGEVITIAAPMVVASMILPSLVAKYRETRPELLVRIVDTGVEWLCDRVLIGEADIAIGPDRAVPKEIVRCDLITTRWVVWCRPDHPLAGRDEALCWQDLDNEPLYAAGRDHEQSVAPILGKTPSAEIFATAEVVDNLTTAFGIAGAGMGISLAPDYVAPLAHAFGLVSRRLHEPEIVRRLSVYSLANRSETEAHTAFRDWLAAQLSSLAASCTIDRGLDI